MNGVKQYIKLPVTISAIQWTGSNLYACKEFLGESFGGYKSDRCPNGKHELTVLTLEGKHIASKNDYLIKGVEGECYPCKPNIFIKTYTEVDK